MPSDDWDDDEDWSDVQDGDDSESDELTSCPECGDPIPGIIDWCPTCGYWLTDTDRQVQTSQASRPLWVRVAAALIILACLYSLIVFRHSLF